MTRDLYSLACECGDKATSELDYSGKEMWAGFQCPGCGRILIGHLSAEGGKYSRAGAADKELAILQVFQEEKPTLTVRRIYYALTVRNVVSKDMSGYRKTCYILKKMRESGALPYGWIADNTRWQIKPETYTGLDSALELWQQAYRRDLWVRQPDYVEIWVEKDALAGVINPITSKYDVPLMVARGYSSMSFIYDAAEHLKTVGKPVYIYHFGDFDASGVDAAEKIKDGLLSHGAEFHFERIAITQEQVNNLNLAIRPNKKKDPRFKNWPFDYSCELDAMPTPILRELVEDCIKRHMDMYQLDQELFVQKQEKQTLAAVLENYRRGAL